MINPIDINFFPDNPVFYFIPNEGVVNVKDITKQSLTNPDDFVVGQKVPDVAVDFNNPNPVSGIKLRAKSIAEDNNLPIAKYDDNSLDLLGKGLAVLQGDHNEDPFSFSNTRIPAVCTYWGQFIAHDVDLFELPNFTEEFPTNKLKNGRTPKFDLDSVFGGNAVYNADGTLATEINVNGIEDLPRNPQGIAQIGDVRNDENKIISQIQLSFIKYYNKVLNELKTLRPDKTQEQLMNRAKNLTRWAYQWITANEYLKLICGANYPKLFNPDGTPKMDVIKPDGKLPIEFSFAAFRLHVLVRELYYASDLSPEMPILDSDFNIPQFIGFTPNIPETVIDWSHFLPIPNAKGFQTTSACGANASFPLTKLFPPIISGPPIDIEGRTLRRQNQVQMSSGQEYAKLFGFKPISNWNNTLLNPAFLDNNQLTDVQKQEIIAMFEANTPLWMYVVKEAELQTKGQHLGELGSAIVAQSIFAMMYSFQGSFINKGWVPKAGEWGCTKDGDMTFTDFFMYANDIPMPENVWHTPTIHDNLFKPNANHYLSELQWLNDFAILNMKVLNKFTVADVGKTLTINFDFVSDMIDTNLVIRDETDVFTLQQFTIPAGTKQAILTWIGNEFGIFMN